MRFPPHSPHTSFEISRLAARPAHTETVTRHFEVNVPIPSLTTLHLLHQAFFQTTLFAPLRMARGEGLTPPDLTWACHKARQAGTFCGSLCLFNMMYILCAVNTEVRSPVSGSPSTATLLSVGPEWVGCGGWAPWFET